MIMTEKHVFYHDSTTCACTRFTTHLGQIDRGNLKKKEKGEERGDVHVCVRAGTEKGGDRCRERLLRERRQKGHKIGLLSFVAA